MSAFLCAVLHSLVFLRLRGNLSGEGWRSIRYRSIPRSERWALKLARDELDSRMYKVAAQLMWCVRSRVRPPADALTRPHTQVPGASAPPSAAAALTAPQFVYTLLIIPIAVCRFVDFASQDVPFWLTIAADFVFNLNGARSRSSPSSARAPPDARLPPHRLSQRPPLRRDVSPHPADVPALALGAAQVPLDHELRHHPVRPAGPGRARRDCGRRLVRETRGVAVLEAREPPRQPGQRLRG